MYNIAFLRDHREIVERNNKRRGCTVDLGRLIEFDALKRQKQAVIDVKRGELHRASLHKPTEEERAALRQLGEEIQALEQEYRELDESYQELFAKLPNLISDEVPDGKDDADNAVVRVVGTPPTFSFQPKDHLELGELTDTIDVKRASSVTGSGFYYLKNELALLRLALHRWGWEKLYQEGFTLMTTPHLAQQTTLFGTGYLPFFAQDVWKLEGDKLSLIGTSEQTLIAYHGHETLLEGALPLRYSATSQCFRTEAGSYGKDTYGIFRVHEFWKMEMILFTTPEHAEAEHERTLQLEEWFVQGLELPYRVVLVCTGDCGAPGYKKYDIEAWFAAQERYRELTSNTNLTDFQTRRLGIRMKTRGSLLYPYTISATALTDRFLLAMLEHYQQEDGSVRVPDVLLPYVPFTMMRPRQ